MEPLYPLRFRPILRQYIWGGRRLGTLLGKPIGPEGKYAESWEVCDHDNDQSVVAFGSLAGTTLGELVAERGEALLGRHHPQKRFPLLLKFLDAADTLSVQVHPNDAQAARLDPPDFGKTEAWYVLAADPGSVIYAGLKPGVDRDAVAEAIREGRLEELLHCFEPRPGQCVLIPSGTVHALGAGVVVAEIQQTSDVTYRLFDWNRVGPDGKSRPLHVEQGLEAIDFDRGPVSPRDPQPAGTPGVSRLVECDKFVLDLWEPDSPRTVGGDSRCHILAVIDGQAAVEGDPAGDQLTRGGTALVPASLGSVRVSPAGRSVLLDMYLP
jgi:mannose-6-phosphate isomerase